MSSSENSEIEERIYNDIVVDCYDELERSTGWHCYLDDRLSFPLLSGVNGITTENERAGVGYRNG